MRYDNKTKIHRVPDKYAHVYTCTHLSEHLDSVSHDVISNFLKRSRITPKQVWEQVKDLLTNSEESCLIIDDSLMLRISPKTHKKVASFRIIMYLHSRVRTASLPLS